MPSVRQGPGGARSCAIPRPGRPASPSPLPPTPPTPSAPLAAEECLEEAEANAHHDENILAHRLTDVELRACGVGGVGVGWGGVGGSLRVPADWIRPSRHVFGVLTAATYMETYFVPDSRVQRLLPSALAAHSSALKTAFNTLTPLPLSVWQAHRLPRPRAPARRTSGGRSRDRPCMCQRGR
jgi:hypothetical protein